MVADTASEVNGALPLFWRKWQHAETEKIPSARPPVDLQMAKPAQPETELHVGRIPSTPQTLCSADTEDLSQPVYSFAHEVSTTEEPDAGNPLVRFREGHPNAAYGLNSVALLATKERRNGENKSNLTEVV